MYWLTAPRTGRVCEAKASITRQAVCLFPSCTHEVDFCMSNYPSGFYSTNQYSSVWWYACNRHGMTSRSDYAAVGRKQLREDFARVTVACRLVDLAVMFVT
jgi:hypothetical protein